MNVFFRVDSNKETGAGHLARCSYLANFLNLKTSFLTFFITGKEDFINHKFINVKKQFFIDCADKISDAEETIKIIRERPSPRILIIDSYLHDESWESRVRPHVDLLIVIDDLANRMHDCDVLIDCGYQRVKEDYDGKVKPDTKVLLGLDYCFISQDIQNIKGRQQDLKRIHLYFGSAIPNELVLRYFSLLKKELPAYSFNIALTAKMGPEQDKIWNDEKGSDDLIFTESPLCESISGCAYGIGAPGVATWERAFLGIPGMYIATNDNQVEIIKNLEAMNFCKFIGDLNQSEGVNISIIKSLFTSNEIQALKNGLDEKVDGKGFLRVLEVMKHYEK